MPKFNIKSIQVSKVKNSSALLQNNENAPLRWKSFKKENQGFGEINGEKLTIKNIWDLTHDQNQFDQN